jgi:two-component system NarL family sensor kinase
VNCQDASGSTTRETGRNLSERLIGLCAGFRLDSGIPCHLLVIPSHAELKPLASAIVFRAIRELLNNVQQHAQATSVEVSSTIRDDGTVEFSVRDDGVGLVEPVASWQPGEDGVGLWSVIQRLREVGGFLETESDGGACFRIVLPASSFERQQDINDAGVT